MTVSISSHSSNYPVRSGLDGGVTRIAAVKKAQEKETPADQQPTHNTTINEQVFDGEYFAANAQASDSIGAAHGHLLEGASWSAHNVIAAYESNYDPQQTSHSGVFVDAYV